MSKKYLLPPPRFGGFSTTKILVLYPKLLLDGASGAEGKCLAGVYAGRLWFRLLVCSFSDWLISGIIIRETAKPKIRPLVCPFMIG
jgi:hypothetical protein